MTSALDHAIHLVWIDSDVVVFDLEGDAYSCLVADRCDPPPVEQSKMAGRLSGIGLDHRIPPAASRRPTAGRWRDLPPASTPRIGASALWHFVVSLFIAVWRFRFLSTARLVSPDNLVPDIRARSSEGWLHQVAEVVAQFEAMAVLMPFAPACLFRCLWMRRFLQHRGFATSWVFGVQLFPFRAHCWLAHEHWVIGDASHRVGSFSPIYVAAPC